MIINEKINYILFGIGNNFYSYLERLDSILNIVAFSDNSCDKWGKYLMGDERLCIPPDKIMDYDNPHVIICSQSRQAIKEIEAQMNSYGVDHSKVSEVLNSVNCAEISVDWPQLTQRKKIKKFIEILVHGTMFCNLHCDYCYVWKKKDFTHGNVSSEYSPEEFRKALSIERLGGVCHLNLCALGETLLADDIEKYVYQLADEGHYISIITNGTITKKINEICDYPEDIQQHIFFKLSFHYAELVRTNQLDQFWNNVNKIRNSLCSYSIEITPSDLVLDCLDEIKEEFIKNAYGAMPHITFTRDAQKKDLDLYSELSLEEYKKIWGEFDSQLFNVKCDLYKKKICNNCYAGCWSYRVNLVNGNLQSCYENELRGNIFEDMDKPLELMTVKDKCKISYCFNNHAFIGWGTVPDIKCCSYLEMRDRVGYDGMHWVKEQYADIMSQKLYDNNYNYVNKWTDYERLYDKKRKSAFILFNSPDYGNLGDQAIAFSERIFLNNIYPDKEFIEISCEQYLKENLNIKNAIRDDDIILLTGGGYMGSIWKWLEDLSLNIITRFPNNKVIIMPQTVYFSNDNNGEYEKILFKKIVDQHNDLAIFVRDRKSEEVIRGLSFENVWLVPDMALALDLSKFRKDKEANKAIVCIRTDTESMHQKDENYYIRLLEHNGYNVTSMTTTVDYEINQCDRTNELESLWSALADAELVITDRLHMVMFCCLLGIPCLAIDNSTGKVFDFVETWGKFFSVKKLKDENDIAQARTYNWQTENDFKVNDLFEPLITYLERSGL